MDDLAILMARHEIRMLKARCVRAMDEKDWAGYAACHTPDAVSLTFQTQLGAPGPVRGGEAIAAALKAAIKDRTPIHHAHEPEIAVTSETTAEGIWPVEYMRFWDEDGAAQWGQGYGWYRETYAKVDGRWLIASRALPNIRLGEGPALRRSGP
jgi:hypothetical protein